MTTPDETPEPPWMSAWRLTQAEIQRLAGGGTSPETDPAILATRRMLGFGNDYAALAADFWRRAGVSREPGELGAELAEHYRRLFMPAAATGLAMRPPAGAAPARWERAARRMMQHAESIAIDAGRRLSDALADVGPAAAPITTLRGFFELWIECGEAAWAAAAHREEFAEAQAEWLAALVELRRDPSPR